MSPHVNRAAQCRWSCRNYNIRPVFDVQADVQGRDLGSVANAIDKRDRRRSARLPSAAVHIELAGQVETMRESFTGLSGGMGLAVVLVFLLMVDQFSELARSVDRADGRAVCAGRRDVDAVTSPTRTSACRH